MELSWTVRSADGKAADCKRELAGGGTDSIGDVWLCARSCTVILNGNCVGDEICPVHAWPCDRLHGSTSFEIVAGRKELWIQVMCPGGSVANVTVPEPIIRDIADGEVTQLNAVLITVPAQGAACSTS